MKQLIILLLLFLVIFEVNSQIVKKLPVKRVSYPSIIHADAIIFNGDNSVQNTYKPWQDSVASLRAIINSLYKSTVALYDSLRNGGSAGTIPQLNPDTAQYYVAVNGSDSNTGTDKDHPFATIKKAMQTAVAGNLIYVRGGTYYQASQFNLTSVHNGTSKKKIKVWAYPGETPVFSPATSGYTYGACGVYMVLDNYHFKGLEFTGFVQTQTGNHPSIQIEDSDGNIFEQLNVHHNGGQVLMQNVCDSNLFKNCDFHHNYDPYDNGGNADGLQVAFITSTTVKNWASGCRFWYNSDDGVDLYNNEGTMIFDNCWSWRNGQDWNNNNALTGDGNGFKLGASQNNQVNTTRRIMRNCISFYNRTCGYNQNSVKAASNIYNCVSYHNGIDPGWYSPGFAFNYSSTKDTLRNNIGFDNLNPTTNVVTQSTTTHDHNSWNSGYTANSLDFVTLDFTGADGARKSNGDLPTLNLLRLVSGSDMINTGVNVGITYLGSAPDLGAFEKQ